MSLRLNILRRNVFMLKCPPGEASLVRDHPRTKCFIAKCTTVNNRQPFHYIIFLFVAERFFYIKTQSLSMSGVFKYTSNRTVNNLTNLQKKIFGKFFIYMFVSTLSLDCHLDIYWNLPNIKD